MKPKTKSRRYPRTLSEAEAMSMPLLEKHGLGDWRISFENLRNPFITGGVDLWGAVHFESKTIRLDSDIGWRFRQTLLHEIAHALRGNVKPGHDKEWCEIAERVGCTFAHLLPYWLAVEKGEPIP